MPGSTDKMSRDVRASLKECAAKGGKYFKGTAALFLRSGSEYVGGQLPTVVGMIDVNREILQDTAKFLRNPVDSINRTVNKAMGTQDFKALRKLGENMLDDLKTGNLYDPDRVRSGFGEEVDGLLDSFGDFDMSGFDENGDWSESEGEEEWEKQLKLAEAQEGTAAERTGATIDAIGASTQAIVTNDNANAQANIRMSLKQHAQLMSAAQNMITQQAAAVQAVNQTATSILEVTREAHNQVIDNLKGITALLTEIKQNTTPPVQERDKVRESLEVFGAHGELNIANLIKSAKKKADDKYHISSMLSMATGGMSLADLIDTVGNDPWQMVTDGILRQMMPKSLKRQFETTGRKLEGFFPALLTKWGEAGKRFDSGESESMWDFFKGLLGTDERSRKFIDSSMKNITAPATFTNKTAKAIEEVIPQLLSQLHTDLTGDLLKAFNYGTGRFDNVIDVISQQTHSANDLANRMGSAASEFIDMTKAVKFSDAEMEKRFDQFRYQFLQKAAEDTRFLDPYQDRDKFREAGPSASSRTETKLFSDIMQRALINMGQAGLENLSAEILDARRSRNSANASINNSLRDSGQMIAFSGLIDQALQSEIESKTKKIGGGLRGKDLDDVVTARDQQLAKAGIPKANNIVINNIRDILERGIITYTYILGGSKGMSDDAKGGALAAQKASKASWDAYNKRVHREEETKARNQQSIRDENARRAVKMRDPARDPAEVYVGGRDDIDWDVIDRGMKYNQINRAARENGELIIDNVGIKRFEQDTPEGAKRTLERRQAELSRRINSRLDRSGFKGFQQKVQEYGKVPFELVENGLKLVDSFLFRILYGEDASDVLLDGHKLPSILDAVRINVKAQWLSAKSWFAENIGNPLKHHLFDNTDGIIPQIGNRINQLIVNPMKSRAMDIKNKLIGTREVDENGKPIGDYKGGRFSSQINSIRNRASDLASGAKDRLTGAKGQGSGLLDRVLYGGMKKGDTEATADGVMNRTRYRYDRGKRYLIREQETEYGWQEFAPVFDGYVGAAGAFRKAIDKFNDMMFGPDEDGDDHGSKAKFNLVTGELKKAFPDMAIGAGVGVIGSLFLPGGPILGALLGSTGGFIASSDAFKDVVFGKLGAEEEVPTFNWETGKFDTDKMKKVRKRSGGMINGEIVEAFKKFAPKIAIGSGLGLVGSLFLPGGPFIGALMGGIGGMSIASDRMKQLLFGTYTDSNGNEQDGLLGPKTREAIKNAAGPALGGAALGGAAWSLISSIGIIPGLSLLPGGPVFALLGGITGAMNADAIKNYFFGEELESTEEVTDKDGNPTGQTRKVKKRVGGLFGKAFDFARDKMLTPFTERINAAGVKVGDWFTASVVKPFENALQPMKDQFKRAGTAISDSMKNIGEHIKDSIAKMFANPNDPEDPREQMKAFFKNKILNPLDRLVSGIFNTIGKVIGGIVSAPFKAMELIFAGTIGGKSLDEISDERAAARKAKEKERAKKRDERMANRRNNTIGRIAQGIGKRFGALASKYTGGLTGVGSSGDTPSPSPASTSSSDNSGAGDVISGDGGDTSGKAQIINVVSEEARRAAAAVEANRGPDKEGVNVARNRNAEDAAAKEADKKEKREDATREERDRLQRNMEQRAADEAAKPAGSDNTSSTTIPANAAKTGGAAAVAGTDGGTEKRTGIFKNKSNNAYLKDIAKTTDKIFGEIKGQLGGSGWNIAYIKTLLDKKFGKLRDDELPEEMEGSKSVKKRRGILGRIKDRVFGVFGSVKDTIQTVVDNAIGVVLTPFKLLGNAVNLVKDGVVGAAKTMWEVTKTAGSVLKELAIGAAKGVGHAIAGAGKLISSAAMGVGRALGDVVSTMTGVLHDGILAVSGIISGAVQFAGAMIPEVGMGIWKGMKFLGKGAGKAIGLAWKGVKGATSLAAKGIGAGASWAFNKITGRKKDKEGRPRGGSYPISISTKTATMGAVPFPIMSLAMPIKPSHAIPVFLVGAFKEAFKGAGNQEDDTPTNSGPDIPALPSGRSSNGNGNDIEGNDGTPKPANAPTPSKTFKDKATESINKAKASARNRIMAFKRKYFSVDRRAESARNPAEEYDRAMQSANSEEDIKAIQAVQQMNANNADIIAGSEEGEKKSSGLLGILGAALGTLLGGGGIKGILKTIGAKTGINAVLKKAGSALGSTLLDGASIGADVFQIGSDKGNTLWGMENLAMKGSKIVKAAVSGSADDVAKLGPVQKAIAKVIRSLMNNSVVKKMFGALKNKIGPLTTKLTKFISDKVLKKAMQTGAGKAVKSGIKQIAAWGSGGIIAVGFAIADFVSGFGNAKKYFNVFGSDVTLGMRLTSAVVNTLGGLLGLIPVAGSFLSIAVAMMQDDVVQLVYEILAGDEAKQQLLEHQAELQAATDEYNAENGTNLTVDEYAKKFNKDGSKRGGIFSTIGGAIGSGLSKVGGFFGDAAKAVGGAFGSAGKAIGGAVGAVVGGVKGAVGTVAEVVSNPGKFFGETLPFMIGQTAGHAYNFGAGLWKGVTGIFGKVKDKLVAVKDGVINFFTGLPEKVGAWFTKTWTGIKEKAVAIKDGAINFVKTLPDRVVKWATNTWTAVTEKAVGIKDAIVDFVVGIPDRIKEFFEDAWESAKEAVEDAVETVKSVPDKVKDWAGNAVDSFKAGFASVTGLGPGDDNRTMLSDLTSTIKNAISDGFGTFKNISASNGLDTSSVSKYLMSAIRDPKALFNTFGTIGSGIGESLINMVQRVMKSRKSGPTIFSIMGEGLGNSLVADLKNTEGKNATITNAVGTAMAATVSSTTTTQSAKKGFIGKTVSKVKSLFGKGPDSEDEWGTGATPMSQSSGKWNRGSNSMAKTGCGPTAAAIVASAYGDRNANPGEADAMSRRMGMRASDGGTNPSFYSKYAASHGFGMRQGPVDPNRISANLKNGQPVVVMGKGGAYGKGMHYMVAEKGKGSNVGIIDPLTGGRKSVTMGKLLDTTKTAVYSYGKGSGWGRGYEDEAENYDENGNLKGVSDQAAAKLAAQTGISYASAKKTGGNPLNKPFKVTSPFGTRTLNGTVEGHKGIDLVPTDGSGKAEVGSRWNGTVTYVVKNIKDSHTGLNVSSNTGGNMVFIKTDEGYTAKHMHLKAGSIPDAIVKGAKVKVGQKLGDMGTTGRSTGPHLHYQLEDEKGIPFNPYSSVSGGDTLAGFTDGYTSGTSSTSAAGTASGSAASSVAGVAGTIGAAGILSALSTVFSSVSDKFGGILSILMGGNPVDDGADSETSGDLSTTGSSILSGAVSGALNSVFNFGSSAGSVDATEAKNTIWKWLRSEYGLTEPATAGLMGCWEHESGNRPDRLEGDYLKPWRNRWSSINDVLANNANLNEYTLNYLFPAYDRSNISISKPGYKMADGNYYPGIGLAQWTKGRAYNLMQFAKSMNMDWRDVKTQLAFFRHETSKSYPNLKSELNAETTPENAARAALDGFEMYKGWSSKPKGQQQWAARAKSAAQIYNTYKGTQVTDKGDRTKAVIYTGEDKQKRKKIDSLNVPTLTDIVNDTTAKAKTKAVGGEIDDEEWGTGPAVNLGANVQALNRQIAQINKRMERVREDAAKETTVAEVTRHITDAMKSTDSSSSETDKLLTGFASMMAQMVEHLAAIRKNTEKKDDTDDDTTSTHPKVKTGKPIYPNGDNEADDVGAAIIDSMTGI